MWTPDPNQEREVQAAFDGYVKVPPGWKLVPIEPTPEMLDGCKRALKRYLDAMPEDERFVRFGRKGPHGHRVDPDIKATIRYRAMLDAAPQP